MILILWTFLIYLLVGGMPVIRAQTPTETPTVNPSETPSADSPAAPTDGTYNDIQGDDDAYNDIQGDDDVSASPTLIPSGSPSETPSAVPTETPVVPYSGYAQYTDCSEQGDGCIPCDPGQSCFICPSSLETCACYVGTFCPGNNNSYYCAPGTFVAAEGTPECDPTPAGYYSSCSQDNFDQCTGVIQEECDPGFYSTGGASACNSVPAVSPLLLTTSRTLLICFTSLTISIPFPFFLFLFRPNRVSSTPTTEPLPTPPAPQAPSPMSPTPPSAQRSPLGTSTPA